MNTIAICIPTYKRPEMLRNLMLSISQAHFSPALIHGIHIIIVDNDAEKTAESTALECQKLYTGTFSIEYHNYPAKGLANVRNELLNKSLESGAEFLAFVDDDEYVSPGWLNELLTVMITNQADLVMGPVISILGSDVSKYISCWFERPHYENNLRLDYLRTGNLLIRIKSLTDRNIRFDHRFNSTGGEDAYFGFQMTQKGASIHWSSDAIVYETIPEKRTSLKWLIRRSYNGAVTYTRVLKIEKNYRALSKKFLVNIIYFLSGCIALIAIPFPIRKKYWGLLRISESLGGFAGLMGIPFNAYA